VSHNTDDLRIREIKELAPPAHVMRAYPASAEVSELVYGTRQGLHRILHASHTLGAAEARVAAVVSNHPAEVVRMSMAHLAQQAQVSDPTIIRFCRRFGFDGYQDFKLHLAQSLVPTAPFAYDPITAHDTVAHIVRKTAHNTINAIDRARQDIDPTQIAEAAALLAQSPWTGIYASGISEIAALDAEHKFQRLGLRCTALIGREKQWLHAQTARAGEVVLIFSQSGHTRLLVEVAESAQRAGVHVIAITAADSPLSATGALLVALSPYEHTELFTPLASRINQHLVVNMLVSTIAKSRGAEFPDQLRALDSWQTEKI